MKLLTEARVVGMPLTDSLIDNPHSQRIRRLADLKERRFRQRHQRFIIEGPQSVREAVDCRPDLVTDLYVEVRQDGTSSTALPVNHVLTAITESALTHDHIYVHPVTARVMRAISTDAQGIVAQGRVQGMAADPGDLASGEVGSGSDLIAAFWQVRDPGNAGTVIRTADAAGCKALILVDDCVDPLNPKVLRSTAGSAFHIPIFTMGVERLLDWSRECGRRILAADVHGIPGREPQSLPEVLMDPEKALQSGGDRSRGDGSGPLVLFGNEARGLPDTLLQQVDSIVSIPIYGRAESLNLATSAAVILYGLAMSSRIERI